MTLFAAALAISGRASAGTLSPPSVGVTVGTDPNKGTMSDSNAGPFASAISSSGDSFADAFAFLSPSPGVDVLITGNSNPQSGFFPRASGAAIFDFEIHSPVGAPLFALVPIDVNYAITSQFSEGALFGVAGSVQFGITSGGFFVPNPDQSTNICETAFLNSAGTACYSNGVQDPILLFSEAIGFDADIVQTEQLSAALTYFSSDFSPTFNASVVIDPTLTIDPHFLALNPGYTLEFSDGVGNSPDAPEPATWVTMLAGVGAAIGVARHVGSKRGLPCKQS